MTPQEILQAKVTAIQSAGPAGSIDTIKERFEFLIADAIEEAVKAARPTLTVVTE